MSYLRAALESIDDDEQRHAAANELTKLELSQHVAAFALTDYAALQAFVDQLPRKVRAQYFPAGVSLVLSLLEYVKAQKAE